MNSFPDSAKSQWCLYDTTQGKTILKHYYQHGLDVPCPHCGQLLRVEKYKVTCCGQEFKTSGNEISQREPLGRHSRVSGCGWQSLRQYEKK